MIRIFLTIFAVKLLTLPWLKIVGAALLGYLAGEMVVSDPKMVEWFPHLHHLQELVIFKDKLELSLLGLICAALVVFLGKILGRGPSRRRDDLLAASTMCGFIVVCPRF